MTTQITLELKGKFLSAKKLNISEKQRCGLIKTLAWLEAGKLDQKNECDIWFDMGQWGASCGTACCLGGTAELLGNVSYDGIRMRDPEIHRLFYPGHALDNSRAELTAVIETEHACGWKASSAQGAKALRGYLETGRADWAKAMRR